MAEPLSGIRVLETGDSIATGYAGKLLRDLGAAVDRVAPPVEATAPQAVRTCREVLAAFLHKGKSLVDVKFEPASYDIVIMAQPVSMAPMDALDPAAFAAGGGILIAITNFGLEEGGPADLMADILAQAFGGFVLLTGLPDHPPTRNQASLPQFQAAMFGVIGALAALLNREAGGVGEVVDVSLYESVAFLMEREDIVYTHQHTLWTRSARHKVVHPFTILPCRDGHVALAVASPLMFQSLMELIGRPELAEDHEILLNTLGHADLIDGVLLPWLADHDRYEITELCQERRIPASPVLDFADLLEDAHMQARTFFRGVEFENRRFWAPGPPYIFHPE